MTQLLSGPAILQPPLGASAAPDADSGARDGHALRWLLLLVVVMATLGQRFGLNIGSYSLSLTVPAMYGLLAFAALSGRAQVSVARLLLVLACLAVATASMLVNLNFAGVNRASAASLLLLAVIYLPLAFVLVPSRAAGTNDDGAWILRAFSNLALFLALAGIAQFHLQFVYRPDWLFDFTAYIPVALQGPSGYNTVIPVGSLFKSNGFFFREPSGYSFLMALALILEWACFRRWWRIGCFALALVLTYSGTGLLALLIGMAFPLGLRSGLRLAALAVAGGLTFWLLGDALNLGFTFERLGEFDSERSSGYIRYIAPLRLVFETLGAQPWTALLGHGPGSISRTVAGYEFHDPTWAKLLYEYGLLGLVAFAGLMLLVLRQPAVPIQVRAALFFCWLIMGGHLLTPENVYLAVALVGLATWPKTHPAPAAAPGGTVPASTSTAPATAAVASP